MSNVQSNLTILLASQDEAGMEELQSYINILQAKNLLSPGMHNRRTQIPPILFWTLICIPWFCVLVVSYFRYMLYDYLFQQLKLKELKPIDTLTFLAAIIDHLSTTIMIVYGTVMLVTGKQFQHIIGGRWACILIMYITSFGMGYSFIGGLMISIYRIILITDSAAWIKNKLGLKTIYRLILLIGISLASSSVFLMNSLLCYKIQ